MLWTVRVWGCWVGKEVRLDIVGCYGSLLDEARGVGRGGCASFVRRRR